tara:strand:+ start:407 stop:742 length:336 start_codon:yes stop_codon:yes gene_type:complete
MKSAASHAYTIASFFHWDAIPKFNQIAEQEMRSVSNKETELGRRFGLLDVYPMSILRPDAHGEGNVHVREMPNDCVHFALPGVPDWWSHQLQTQLNELSNCALSAWRTGEG